jgi:hypothetical protein
MSMEVNPIPPIHIVSSSTSIRTEGNHELRETVRHIKQGTSTKVESSEWITYNKYGKLEIQGMQKTIDIEI